jgi:AcrR family transcriptional regulator
MTPRTKEQNEEIRRQTRQQILDAAFELFANEGFTKTSIAAVAKKAEVSKGLIYHYFDSKQDILNGIFGQLIELGEDVLEMDESLSPREKIRTILNRTFHFIENKPDMARLMVSLALQPGTFNNIQGQIKLAQDGQLKQYVELFEELGYEQPELEAYELGATIDGIMMGYISMGDEYPLQELKTKILENYASS